MYSETPQVQVRNWGELLQRFIDKHNFSSSGRLAVGDGDFGGVAVGVVQVVTVLLNKMVRPVRHLCNLII